MLQIFLEQSVVIELVEISALTEPEGSSPFLQKPSLNSIMVPWNYIQVFQIVSSHETYQPKYCMYFIFPSCSYILRLWATGWIGVRVPAGVGIFPFIIASRPVLGPTQPPIQWVPGALSLGIKRPRREAYHSLPSSAEVKECVELYLHSPTSSHGVVLSWKSTGATLPLTFKCCV
jgi:hypothetical protein